MTVGETAGVVLDARPANGGLHGPIVYRVLLEDGRVLWPLFAGEVRRKTRAEEELGEEQRRQA